MFFAGRRPIGQPATSILQRDAPCTPGQILLQPHMAVRSSGWRRRAPRNSTREAFKPLYRTLWTAPIRSPRLDDELPSRRSPFILPVQCLSEHAEVYETDARFLTAGSPSPENCQRQLRLVAIDHGDRLCTSPSPVVHSTRAGPWCSVLAHRRLQPRRSTRDISGNESKPWMSTKSSVIFSPLRRSVMGFNATSR